MIKAKVKQLRINLRNFKAKYYTLVFYAEIVLATIASVFAGWALCYYGIGV